LLFVTAVGLGPFPGALALSVHSIGMVGRLVAETIEHMDMAPIEALTLTGARRVQVFTHGIIPSIRPSLLGIVLYRLDENIRSSLLLGFVGVPLADHAQLLDRQGRVHARVSVDFVKEFGCYLGVPMRRPDA
jgi:ABC-type methionine transport system permease subunit